MSRSFKVDNWGSLLLQRIQQLYEKGEHCDMLLKFTTGEELPIHRLILHSCCNFFAILEGTEALENSTLHLPPELTREALDPVIRFMYTGQLDISEGSLSMLSATAQLLDMPLLEQLLQTHAVSTSESTSTPAKTPQRTIHRPKSGTPYNAVSAKPSTPKSGTKPALLPPAPSRLDLSVGDSTGEYGSLPKMTQLLTEPAPTTPTVNPLVPLIRNRVKPTTPVRVPKREKTELKFDELRKTAQNPAPLQNNSEKDAEAEPEAKKLRTEDIEGFKELLAEQRRRSELAAEEGGEDAAAYDTGVDVGLVDWDEEDDEDEEEAVEDKEDNGEQQNHQHKSILKSSDTPTSSEVSKRVHFSEDNASGTQEEAADAEEQLQEHDPSLLTSSELSNSSTPSKDSSTITIFDEDGHVLLREVIHSNVVTSQVQARMISEVLKRSPSLVTSGNNTKLKIVQRSPWYSKAKVSYVLLKPAEEEAAPTTPKGARYSNAGSTPGSRRSSSNHSGSGSAIPVNKRSSPYDNTTGPWICYECIQTPEGSDEPEALQLRTYYEYRSHLVDVHGLKPDSQACDYCGHRALKRNHMLYHLYTIHGVPPPAHMKFPQCSECDYVALTSAIMKKHLQKHQEGVGHQCRVCNEPFTSLQGLLQHLHFTGHQRGHSAGHLCPVEGCGQEFSRLMLLQSHIRTMHKDLALQFDREGWPEKFDSTLVAIPETAVDQGQTEVLQESQVFLEQTAEQAAEGGEMAWVATNAEEVVELAEGEGFPTEATLVAVTDGDAVQAVETEALTNMANSIASSLGIAVTTTTVTTTEDGYTVAYLTTAEDGTQYITGDVVEATGEEVAAPELMSEGECSQVIAIQETDQEDQNMEQVEQQ